MNSAKKLALLAISLLLIGGMLSAQQTTAKIFGVVQLEDGSLVPGVSVEATSAKLVGKETAVTDENGAFRLVNLTPGNYKLVFSLQGFQTVVRENIPLVSEQTLNLKVQMKLGNIEEAVTITGQVALIDVKSTAKGMTLTKEMFDVLPKGRNFDGLVAVIPGALNENVVGGLSIDGSTGGENMFYVDGQNTNSMFGGQGKQAAAFDFVDEVQVKASGYQAEFGGSLGGVINVVTRAGGNEFHGDVVGYYSGSVLRGTERDTVILNPAISAPSLLEFNYTNDRDQAQTDSRLEAGFGLGGYIIKDKLWFYANVLPVLRNTTVPAIFLYPADPIHAASTPYSNPPVLNKYDYKNVDNDINLQFKLSSQPAKNLRLAVSFVNNFNEWKDALPSRAGGASDSYDYSTLGYAFPNWTVSGNIDYTIGNNTMLSARAGYFFYGIKNNIVGGGNTAEAPMYIFSVGNTTISQFPAALRRPTGWQNQVGQAMTAGHYKNEETNLSAGFDFTYFLNLAGEHAWKAGLAFTKATAARNTLYNAPQVTFTAFRATDGRTSMSINGGANSLPDNINGYTTGQYGDFGDVASNRLAIYLQDSWTIANKFTLNFGVRLEQENVPSFNDDPAWSEYFGRNTFEFGLMDKISPRLGFVWDVQGDSSLKIFGSYGIYNDVMELDMALGSTGGTRWIQNRYYLMDPTRLFEVAQLKNGARDYSGLISRGYVEYRYQNWENHDPDLKPMSQSEMSAGIEKRISENLSLSVRGTWRQLLKTIDDVGVIVPNDEGGFAEVYYLTNPGYGLSLPISQGGAFSDDYWPTPKAERDYKAVNISLEKRMSNNWMGGINVSLSRLFGNYTGIVSGDEAIAGTMGTGRADGNVTRYFDIWWMSYKSNGKQETTNGVLPTDRPVVLKAYGSYAFPFGLTLGGVANWMTGTPRSTEFFVDSAAGYYPLGRNDMGRTPSLWFLNLYAEYNLKLGKNTLQFSVNVDNVSNNDTGTYYYNCINLRTGYTYFEYPGASNLSGGDGSGDATTKMIKNGYDLFALEGTWPQDQEHWVRDPRYGKAILFQAPISARLGVKFMF